MMEISKQFSLNEGTGKFNVLLITANVGTLFEDPKNLLDQWLNTILEKITEVNPDFFALHLQEVGGKTYEVSMQNVHTFIRKMCDQLRIKQYKTARIYMDENFNSVEQFTALGNLYFLLDTFVNVRIWNYHTQFWETVIGTSIYTGNVELISTKEKAKFPKNLFPECKWSRKGYMRTRWELNNTVIELVNIHLFHDASNFAAIEEFPSTYCKYRRRALIHTLQKFYLDEENGCVPFFIFGDFNFRCDTGGVVETLTSGLTKHRLHVIKDSCTKFYYRNLMGEKVFTFGTKKFKHINHDIQFRGGWLRKFDLDVEPLKDLLKEFSVEFGPTYPFEEKVECPDTYMRTRCPSWCDRIFMNAGAKQLIAEESPNSYNIIGRSICMGDHKYIYREMKLYINYTFLVSTSKNENMNKDEKVVKLRNMTTCLSQDIGVGDYYPVKLHYVIIHFVKFAADNWHVNTAKNGHDNIYTTNCIQKIMGNQTGKMFKETSF